MRSENSNNGGLMRPNLAMCNFITDLNRLKKFAMENGFGGIDWSFDIEHLPSTPTEESQFVNFLDIMAPLELRFHCPFMKVDIGHESLDEVATATKVFQKIIKLVSKLNGKYLTLHVGLGRDTTKILSWEDTVDNLQKMVRYGADRGVTICLENLKWGWTSKPNLFEKLIRRTGCHITFDIGHAQSCEAIQSQQFSPEDFITPHLDRVQNAHVYQTEISGIGHLPPENLAQIKDRLDILAKTECRWWTLEIKDVEGLLKTKQIVDEYFDMKWQKLAKSVG